MNRWIVPALMGLIASAAHAADAPLTLAEAERLALGAEPGIQAAESRAAANRERSVSAGELPDPQVRLGMLNLPTDTFAFSQEPMTQAQLGVRQMFPPRGARQAGSRQYQALARGMDENADARRRQVVLEVRRAWLDVRLQESSLATVQGDRDLFSDLVDVSRALYAQGRNNQQDVIRAELELSRLVDRELQLKERVRVARAELARWLGADLEDRPIAEGWPGWDAEPPLDALEAGLLEHPALLAMRERIQAGEAAVDRARAEYRPGWSLDASYGIRNGTDTLGMSRPDFFSVMVSLDVPLFTGNRQDRDVAAAVSDASALESDWRDALRGMKRDLESARASWEQLDERIGLYRTRVIPQAENQADAALLAYRNDTGDFADVMRAHITVLDSHLELLHLRTDRARAWAQIEYLGGNSDA